MNRTELEIFISHYFNVKQYNVSIIDLPGLTLIMITIPWWRKFTPWWVRKQTKALKKGLDYTMPLHTRHVILIN